LCLYILFFSSFHPLFHELSNGIRAKNIASYNSFSGRNLDGMYSLPLSSFSGSPPCIFFFYPLSRFVSVSLYNIFRYNKRKIGALSTPLVHFCRLRTGFHRLLYILSILFSIISCQPLFAPCSTSSLKLQTCFHPAVSPPHHPEYRP